MRKSGIKIVVLATALAMTVTTITATTVTAKKKAKKTVVKLVSLDTAARKYVNKANSSANKKKGTTSLTVSIKGSVSEGKFRNAVSKIHCKNVKKITAEVFKSEILCPNWSKFSVKNSGKYTTFKVKFNNKKMHNFSSYGKVNYFEEVEKKIYKNLAIFEKDFGKETMAKKSQLGAFAVAYCGGGFNRGGDGGATYGSAYGDKRKEFKNCNLDVCAKGLVNKTPKSVECAGVSRGIVRVMRILGFKKSECGIVNNYATNHDWNWWKDGDQVYFGDGQNGVIDFVDQNNVIFGDSLIFDQNEDDDPHIGWGSFTYNNGVGYFTLPGKLALVHFGYANVEDLKEAIPLKNRVFTFEEFSNLYPSLYLKVNGKERSVKGFYACTIEEAKKAIGKNNPIFGASDGKKGTNWKLTKAQF